MPDRSESSPVSVPEQIILLLALVARLFDEVPLDRMGDAEQAVRGVIADIPPVLLARMETAESLSGEEREALVRHAREALGRLDLAIAGDPSQEAEP